MYRKIKKNLLILFILIILIGVAGFNPLRSTKESKEYTPITSDLPFIFGDDNGTLICDATDYQNFHEIISDGLGGAIIVWEDSRVDNDIYAQKINSTGEVEWAPNGIPISTAISWQQKPKICSDGAGGAIIVWEDQRSPIVDIDIYAQRINSTGDPQWTLNGVVICNNILPQEIPNICADGNGGAIISWLDWRDTGTPDFNVYIQKVNSSGGTEWTPNGTAVCTASAVQKSVQMCSDDVGGVIVTWQDERDYGTNSWDLYAQRVNSTGGMEWTSNGVPICTSGGIQWYPEILSDGTGGAFITWEDFRGADYDIYTQRVNSDGGSQWTDNGTRICGENGNQGNPRICSDGMGGAVITWQDNRGTSTDIYAQRIESTGDPQWMDNGTVICSAINSQQDPDISADGMGGAIITWEDNRGTSTDIYAQRVDFDEVVRWTSNGTAICTAQDNQYEPRICSGGIGSVFIVWRDTRFSTETDLYAFYILNDMSPGSNHPGFVITSATGTETIDWILSDDNSGGQYRVWANNSIGNYYVWEDWTPWVSGIPFSVSINRTAPGDYNYTIEYYDDLGQYGNPDTVIVTVTDAIPTSNHPGPIITTKGGSETIGWILYDEFGEGEYRVLANNTLGINYVLVDWTAWTNETSLAVTINRSAPGDFEYTIEFDDDHNQLGVPDMVIVTITDAIPTSNHPADFSVDQDDSRNIAWTLSDDFGGGQYRVLVNGTAGSWTSWTSGVQINHPADTSTVGIYNYTIQYYDLYGLYGVPNIVIVTIEEPTNGDGDGGEPQVPGYNLFFVIIAFIAITATFARKKAFKATKS